ncbi:MAG: hypothetical protein AAF500_14165 [Myxococcota bacterium]
MRRFALLTSCVLGLACSSAGGGSPGGSGGGGQGGSPQDVDTDALFALTEEISNIVVDAIPTPDTPPEQRDLRGELVELGQRLVELDGIDSFYLSGHDLAGTAITTEGLPILFINNRPPPEETLAPSAAPSNLVPKAPVLPDSRRFVAAAYDGGTQTANDVAALLTDAGYQRVSSGAGLSSMRNYTDLAVLHLDTHSASFLKFVPDGNGGFAATAYSFGLQTSTQVGKDTLGNFKDELIAQELLIAYAMDEDYAIAKFAVTELFIEKAWSFDRGVVMLHSCFTGGEPFSPYAESRCFGTCPANAPDVLDPSLLRQAMFNVGAELIVSFDTYTNTGLARPSILHTFDRLLGANEYSKENPEQRPFDSDQVLADLQDRGLDSFEMPERDDGAPSTVNVVFFEEDGVDMLLAPSIERMDVMDDSADPGGGVLTLSGLFGPTRGKVMLDGVEAMIERWADEEITARVPFESPGAGQVTVEFPDGVESNEVPLTEWRGTVTFSLRDTTSSLLSEVEMDLRFRADVHRFRAAIAEMPRNRVVETYVSPASEGRVRGSGSRDDGTEVTRYSGGGSMDVVPKFLVDVLAQGAAVPLAFDKQASGLSSAFGGLITLDVESGAVQLCFDIRGSHDVTVTSEGGGMGTFSNVLTLFPGIGVADESRGALGCFNTSIDTNTYRISGGGRNDMIDEALFEFEWTEFVPVAPPDEDTKG